MNSNFEIGNIYCVTENNKYKITNNKILVNPFTDRDRIYLNTRNLIRALTNEEFKTATLSLEIDTQFNTGIKDKEIVTITPSQIDLNTSIDNTYTYNFSVSSEAPLNKVYSIDGVQSLGYIKNVNGRACILSTILTYKDSADGKYNYDLAIEIMIESGYSKKNPRFVLSIKLLFESLFGLDYKTIKINLVTE